MDISFLALLGGEYKRPHKRHLAMARRIWARNSSRPQPRDYRRFASVRESCFRIEMADALECLVAHPPAVVADVLGKPLRTRPRRAVRELLACFRVHGGLPREPRR